MAKMRALQDAEAARRNDRKLRLQQAREARRNMRHESEQIGAVSAPLADTTIDASTTRSQRNRSYIWLTWPGWLIIVCCCVFQCGAWLHLAHQ